MLTNTYPAYFGIRPREVPLPAPKPPGSLKKMSSRHSNFPHFPIENIGFPRNFQKSFRWLRRDYWCYTWLVGFVCKFVDHSLRFYNDYWKKITEILFFHLSLNEPHDTRGCYRQISTKCPKIKFRTPESSRVVGETSWPTRLLYSKAEPIPNAKRCCNNSCYEKSLCFTLSPHVAKYKGYRQIWAK